MDTVSKEARSRIMAAVRGRDTGPEMRLRRVLWGLGFRYRVDYGRERIDIAFPGQKVAVFVDGCFWHMCPIHGTMPEANASYWKPKLKGNVARDRERDAALAFSGWTVIRIWEHELKGNGIPEARCDRCSRIEGGSRYLEGLISQVANGVKGIK